MKIQGVRSTNRKRRKEQTMISPKEFANEMRRIAKKKTDEEHASKIAYDKRAKLAAQILIDGYGARID